MLASDPHLTLSSPSIFWPVSLHVEGAPEERLQVGGIAFPGLPGIILGHNEHIAWGATTTGYDVTDVYAETLTDGGDAVVFRGAEVPLETIEEVIALPNGESVTYEVKVVPHHGPVIPTIVDGEVIDPDPAVGALSVRWTGMEPTDDLAAIAGLLRARDVDEARAALRDFGTGSQSWMIADDAGNVAWTSHALVPYRDPAALDWDPAAFDGLLPCMVLPGDGTAEWTGLWDDDAVPWAKNPASAYLATANQDLVGGTLDNDPSNDQQPDGSSGYLGCQFAAGFRLARIRERIEAIDRLTLDDMASIQADVRSPLGNRLVPALLLAIESAQAEDSVPGSHPDLSEIVADAGYDAATLDDLVGLLVEWQATGYVAASGVSPDDNQALPLEDPAARASQATLVFNAWLVRMLARTFADEHARIGRSGTRHDLVALLHLFSSDPATLATYDPATGDSALFDDIDTPAIESRHERSIRALIDALSWIGEQGPLADLRWGHFHTLSLQPLLVLFPKLTVPPLGDPLFTNGFPRPGDSLGVDAANFSLRQPLGEDLDFSYGSGPAQRFVIELEPGKLVAHNAIPGGAVGRLGDPHFADQLERWRRNETFAVAFYASDVLAAQESRSLLTPR
jgi:penicillin amidase